MSPSRKYSLVALALSAAMSLHVSAHNHAGEKPTKGSVNVVAMTLPEIVSGLKTGQFSSQDLTRAYLHRIETIDRSGPHAQCHHFSKRQCDEDVKEKRYATRRRKDKKPVRWRAFLTQRQH